MENLLSEGLSLMVFGMGFVAVFLTLLVIATTIMSKIVGKYFPEAPPKPAAKKPAVAAASGSNDELIAVMTAAVHKFRGK